MTNHNMIGMLIERSDWREKDVRPCAADLSRDGDVVHGADLKVRVAAHFEEVDLCSEDLGGAAGLRFALVRGAVAPRFAARADAERDLAPACRFREQDTAAAEFEVVRMRANPENT